MSAATIEVDKLCKTFPPAVRALADVSFSARAGEVLGFLGQNGAGKTTAMRILSGYLRPTSGRAAIAGHDVVLDSLLARRHLGYLPEQVPLYAEMRVREYLRYRAELRGVPRGERTGAVGDAMAETGLLRGPDQDGRYSERLIGHLSRGFRQRVGLADALLHRPAVLVLDEPTEGLDPNQRREILELIRRLGQERAVVLSTHVLPEVETVCQRLVIIDRGRVIAQGSLAELQERMVAPGQVEVLCRGDRHRLRTVLSEVPGVAAIADGGDDKAEAQLYRFVVQLDDAHREHAGSACEALARAVLSCGELRQLMPVRSSMEVVFRWLTQPPEPVAAKQEGG